MGRLEVASWTVGREGLLVEGGNRFCNERCLVLGDFTDHSRLTLRSVCEFD